MTSSERKIINCLWETKEKTYIRLVAQKANLSSDYARLLCRSLVRSGHIKFENDLAHLLKKGRSRFENNDPVADKPIAVTANVTLLADEPAVASPVSDRSDEEEGQEEGASEDNDKDKSESGDEELDKALADLEPSSKKEEGDKIDEPEESEKTESAEEAEVKEEQKEEEILAEPAADNPAPVAPLESSGETTAMKKEEKQEKGDAAKSSNGSGWSFKKIVNWFTEKK